LSACGGQAAADDPAREDVDHEREEDQALEAAQVGQVGNPEPVGAIGSEVTPDEISTMHRARVRPGRSPGPAAPFGALDPGLAHDPLDAITTNGLAGPQHRLPHSPRKAAWLTPLIWNCS